MLEEGVIDFAQGSQLGSACFRRRRVETGQRSRLAFVSFDESATKHGPDARSFCDGASGRRTKPLLARKLDRLESDPFSRGRLGRRSDRAALVNVNQ
jgi:hypothetical protein